MVERKVAQSTLAPGAIPSQLARTNQKNFVFYASIERPNASIRQASSSPRSLDRYDPRAARSGARPGALVTRLLDHPLYRQRLGEAGIEAGAPIGLDDLASLPFTTKRDL